MAMLVVSFSRGKKLNDIFPQRKISLLLNKPGFSNVPADKNRTKNSC